MNLPDYFFADLPPEATLSPAMITASVQTLKRNRERFLRGRTTREMIELLCEAGAGWRSQDGRFRRIALERGPAATGFSRATLEHGLDGFFARFTPAAFEALLRQELGGVERLDDFGGDDEAEHRGRLALARGPELLVHLAAGNVPNPALMSLSLGLLTRAAQFMKCASGAAFLPRLFAHSLYALDPKAGACLEIAEWPGGNLALETVLFAEADAVTFTGGDTALEQVRQRLPPRAAFLAHGRRVSFAYLTREALRPETLAELAARVVDDVIAWDQQGCLSPQVIYVEERGAVAPDDFAGRLAAELARREARAPRARVSTETAARIATRRSIAEALAAHRGDVKLWCSPDSTAWTVVYEHEPKFQLSPLNRFVFVKPVADCGAALRGADEVRDCTSTVGLAAPAERAGLLAGEFARWGATRVCPVGRMQSPPLAWRHDGRPPLGGLVVWTDFEGADGAAMPVERTDPAPPDGPPGPSPGIL